jgi:hypothetical protein
MEERAVSMVRGMVFEAVNRVVRHSDRRVISGLVHPSRRRPVIERIASAAEIVSVVF